MREQAGLSQVLFAQMSTPGVSKLTKLTKRTHKKSRNGCATCKLRRVKVSINRLSRSYRPTDTNLFIV